jgi:nucleotide-binding universal stress UspA family protein
MTLYQHILVPVDDSPVAYAAAEQARVLAAALHCKVSLLSVVAVDPFVGVDFYKVAPAITDYFMQAEKHALLRLEDLKQGFAQDGIHVHTQVLHGMSPADGILKYAHENGTDLIMMGSHRREGLEKMFLGSVAQQVLNQAQIPVLIVKA